MVGGAGAGAGRGVRVPEPPAGGGRAADMGRVPRGLRRLLFAQCSRELLSELPRLRRTDAPGAGTRPGLDPDRGGTARVAVAAAAAVVKTRSGAGGDRRLLDDSPVGAPRLGTLSAVGVSEPRGIPRQRLGVEEHAGRARVSDGSVPLWFNAWHKLAQMGGGSEQGLLNEMVQPASWEIMAGPDPEPGVLWMQCLGVDAVIVSDQRSEEPYKDISHSRKFASVLPAVFDDGLGNTLYKVPRRYPARARVVETAKLAAVRAPQGNVDMPVLRAYADVVEKGPDAPASLERSGTDGMRVRATVAGAVDPGAGSVGPGMGSLVRGSAPGATQGRHGVDRDRCPAGDARHCPGVRDAVRESGRKNSHTAHGAHAHRPPGAESAHGAALVKRWRIPLLMAALLLLNLSLSIAFFMKGDLPYRGSIEGGYGGTARFISAHPDPWGWNPLQYCGLPTQFTYLPSLPYITALSTRLRPRAAPEHLYRAWTGLLTAFGPVMVFAFTYYFTRSWKWALAAGLAFTFVSPVYGMYRQIDRDRGFVQLPWRLQVMAKYGEVRTTSGSRCCRSHCSRRGWRARDGATGRCWQRRS